MPARALPLLPRTGRLVEIMIVVVFDSEAKAIEGCRLLQELDSQGEISIYALQIVSRHPSGRLRVIDNTDMNLPMIAGAPRWVPSWASSAARPSRWPAPPRER